MVKQTKSEMTKIQIDIAVIKEKLSSFEVTMKNINKTISGNGQPGLIQNLATNEEKLENHIVKDTEWKGKKDGSIAGIKWIICIGFTCLSVALALLAII